MNKIDENSKFLWGNKSGVKRKNLVWEDHGKKWMLDGTWPTKVTNHGRIIYKKKRTRLEERRKQGATKNKDETDNKCVKTRRYTGTNNM